MIAIILAVAAILVCKHAFTLLDFALHGDLKKTVDEYAFIMFVILLDIFALGAIGYGAYRVYELIFT